MLIINTQIPIVLFAYARPDHLSRTLECLKINQVPLIYAFSDDRQSSEFSAFRCGSA